MRIFPGEKCTHMSKIEDRRIFIVGNKHEAHKMPKIRKIHAGKEIYFRVRKIFLKSYTLYFRCYSLVSAKQNNHNSQGIYKVATEYYHNYCRNSARLIKFLEIL